MIVTRFEDANIMMAEAGIGYSISERLALWILYHEAAMTPSDLAHRSTMTRQAISSLIARLEKRGDVIVRDDHADRRCKYVSLSGRARSGIARLVEHAPSES